MQSDVMISQYRGPCQAACGDGVAGVATLFPLGPAAALDWASLGCAQGKRSVVSRVPGVCAAVRPRQARLKFFGGVIREKVDYFKNIFAGSAGYTHHTPSRARVCVGFYFLTIFCVGRAS